MRDETLQDCLDARVDPVSALREAEWRLFHMFAQPTADHYNLAPVRSLISMALVGVGERPREFTEDDRIEALEPGGVT